MVLIAPVAKAAALAATASAITGVEALPMRVTAMIAVAAPGDATEPGTVIAGLGPLANGRRGRRPPPQQLQRVQGSPAPPPLARQLASCGGSNTGSSNGTVAATASGATRQALQ